MGMSRVGLRSLNSAVDLQEELLNEYVKMEGVPVLDDFGEEVFFIKDTDTGKMYQVVNDEVIVYGSNKVTVEAGKGLSSNDFSDEYIGKIENIVESVANLGNLTHINTAKINKIKIGGLN